MDMLQHCLNALSNFTERFHGLLQAEANQMPPVAMNRVAAPSMMQNARVLGQQRKAVLALKVKPWP